MNPFEIAERAKEILRQEPDLKLAFLFGSAVTGKMRPDSDVDIACLFPQPLTADRKMNLSEKLAVELGHTIDLVDLYNLSGPILKCILHKGRILFKNSSSDLVYLMQRMIYNQTDFMPYVRRMLLERQRRFLYGS